jgi:hypothetical protein
VGDQDVHRRRPFHWGAIYISDAECRQDFDIDFHHGKGPVLATASHVAVLVAHAGTFDDGQADVTLDVRVRARRAEGWPLEVVFEVPSGRLYIGDADENEELTLWPGSWLLQFVVDDPGEARRVEIVASPLS